MIVENFLEKYSKTRSGYAFADRRQADRRPGQLRGGPEQWWMICGVARPPRSGPAELVDIDLDREHRLLVEAGTPPYFVDALDELFSERRIGAESTPSTSWPRRRSPV